MPLSARGGAEIADFQLNVEKSSFPLDGDVIRQVIRHYEDLDVNFAIPWQGELYAPKDDRLIQRLSRVDHIPYHVVDYDEFLNQPRPKVMIVCDPETMERVVARQSYVYRSENQVGRTDHGQRFV